jgi:hypothetical protein
MATTSWRELPGPARAIGSAVTRAVDAAGDGDRDAYEESASELVTHPGEATGIVLAAIVRSMLEEQHPDGLDGDDIQLILGRCYRGAAAWLPPERIDVDTLIAVLASALGIQEAGITYDEIGPPPPGLSGDEWLDPVAEDEKPRKAPTASAYAWHAPLIIADMLAASGRSLPRYLDGAFAEIVRGETMEMP